MKQNEKTKAPKKKVQNENKENPTPEAVSETLQITTPENKNTTDHKPSIKDMPLGDLMAYKEAANMVFSYYDNMAQSCRGQYDDFIDKAYYEWEKKRSVYEKLEMNIFEEIKKRVDSIL